MSTPPPNFDAYRPAHGSDGPAPGRTRPPAGQPPRRKKRRRPPQAPRRRSSWLGSLLFWSFAGLLVIAGAATAAIYVLSPAEIVRTEMIRQVKANTGRTLTIAGAPSLTFYPSIGVSLPNVSLSPPPGMPGGPMIQSKRIRVSVALMPLLSKRVIVERVELVQPVIDLRVDRSGRRTWDFAGAARPVRYAGLPGAISASGSDATASDAPAVVRTAANAGGQGLEVLDALELRSITITSGHLQYLDQRTGSGEAIKNVNMDIAGRRIADPLSLKGNLVWNAQKIALDGRLETLRKILHGEVAKVRLSVNGKVVNLNFNGSVVVGNATKVVGDTRLKAKSFKNLMRWVGTDLPNGKPLGGLSIAGRLNATPKAVALNGAALALGPTSAKGSVAAQLSGPRPKIVANLNISALDIDKMSAHFSGVRQLKRSKLKPLSPSGAGQQAPKSIEEILRGTQTDTGGAGRFSTQVRGFKKTRGWSRDSIDVAGLKAIDADARLKIAGFRVAGLSIGSTSLRTTINNGSARADISDIALYQGRGRGIITARAAGKAIKIGLNVTLSDVSALPLLTDAADVKMLAGRGRLTAALGGTGRSQHALMSNLAGKATFAFTDGAIIGWNIPQMLRGVQSGRFNNFDKVGSAKTDFSELSASFSVSRGIANTQDLRMNSPLLRLTGSGNTNLGQQQLDMIMRPKLVASLSGQGGQAGLSGIEIPIRVSGPWETPKIQPDYKSVLKNPNLIKNATKTVNQVVKQFKGKKLNTKNAENIVRGLFGGDNKKNNEAAKAAGSLLNNLFKN